MRLALLLLPLACSRGDASEESESCSAQLLYAPPVLLSSRPRIYRLPSLLSSEECDGLIALGQARLRPSEVGVAGDDDASHGTWRNSSSMTFSEAGDGDLPLVTALRRRLSDAALMPEALAEPLQLARYAPTESFGLHTDADIRGSVLRAATVLVYLNDDFGGGETVFPRVALGARGALPPLPKLVAAGGAAALSRQLNSLPKYCGDGSRVLRLTPRKGDGVVFFSLRPDGAPDLDAVHGGCPPEGGTKWVAQQWFNLDSPNGSDSAREGRAEAGGAPVLAARGGEAFATRLSERALQRLRALPDESGDLVLELSQGQSGLQPGS